MNATLDTVFAGLGSPSDMRARAAHGCSPAHRPKVNAHLHLPPNFSAFETVDQAIGRSVAESVRVLGASNYYDYRIYRDFADKARAAGIFPLFGLEIIVRIPELIDADMKINDPGNPGKMYISGKGINRFETLSPEADRVLGDIRRNDAMRMSAMVVRMAKVCSERGFESDIDEDKVIEMIVRRHGVPRETVWLQERHLAQAFQERFFERIPKNERQCVLAGVLGLESSAVPEDHVAVQAEFRTHLMKAGKPAFVEESFIGFDDAVTLICQLGGIPCYPVLADGAAPICGFEDPVEKLIDNLAARNIHFVEFISIRNCTRVLTDYVTRMREAGFVITAGTEHNTLALIDLEPACLSGEPVPEAVKDIFWEGACVAAAHQFVSWRGESGFVDGYGNLDAEYDSAEMRIAAFSRLGAAVIQSYFDSDRDER